MKRLRQLSILAGCVLCLTLQVRTTLADLVHLNDGTTLVGTVVRVAGGQLVMQTAFADQLAVPASMLQGITTDSPRTVQLGSGDRAVGRLVYADGSQGIVGTALGDRHIAIGDVVLLWIPDEGHPSGAPSEAEVAALEAQHDEEVRQLREELEQTRSRWSGRLEFGLDGRSGNQDRLAFRGRAEARRETDKDRLLLYIQGIYSEEDNTRSENEIIGGARLEVDLTERLFAFGRFELEYDEFENLDLRATVSGGLGYWVIREDRQDFRVRGGVGYQHESYDDGTTQDDAVLELGYDYRLDITDNIRLTHDLTYLPTFEDFADYRLVINTGVEVPIGDNGSWRIRGGMRNEYRSEPQPGNEDWDSTYFINLVYVW